MGLLIQCILFFGEAGIINECCPGIDHVTKRWLILGRHDWHRILQLFGWGFVYWGFPKVYSWNTWLPKVTCCSCTCTLFVLISCYVRYSLQYDYTLSDNILIWSHDNQLVRLNHLCKVNTMQHIAVTCTWRSSSDFMKTTGYQTILWDWIICWAIWIQF